MFVWMRGDSDWSFVRQATGFDFPAGTEYLAQYDNAEWFVVSVVRLPADSVPAFVHKYRFAAGARRDTLKASALPEKYRSIPDRGDVLSTNGRSEHQAWEAAFDPVTRLLWIDIDYPDWAGDHPGTAPQPRRP